MLPALFVATIAWDIIQDIRGTVAMMMFILEESIQTAMMAEWIATKEGLLSEALDLNSWIRTYLSNQELKLSESAFANAAYPLNHAYSLFAQATNQSLDIYKEVLQRKLAE